MPDQVTVKRFGFWALPALALILGGVLAFTPRAEPVDIVQTRTAPMRVSVDEEGETRVKDIFTIAAPINGRLLRTPLKVGDAVVADETIVVEIEPSDPDFLDERAAASSAAARDAAAAALELATAELKQAEAEKRFALAEVKRARELYAQGTLPKQRVDDAERVASASTARVDAGTANVKLRRYELNRAKAALISPADVIAQNKPCACVTIRSPVSGKVLQIYQESETVVRSGAPLIDIGDPRKLEVVADLLSRDAVQVQPGQKVVIDGWGGPYPLSGEVRRVEPYGFKKVSALGIEEQRVNVLMDLTDPHDRWQTLGHGYQLDVHIIQWEAEAVLQVPLTALFRSDDGWALFAVTDGRAQQRPVEIGHTAGLSAEVLSGLNDGDSIVLHPSMRLRDGLRVQQR